MTFLKQNKQSNKRERVSKSLRNQVWKLVPGKCHICGKRIKRDAKAGEYGRWHVGHVVAHARKGPQKLGNLLPTCRNCNLILKHSGSMRIKKILRLGVWGIAEIRAKTKLGRQLALLYKIRKITLVPQKM